MNTVAAATTIPLIAATMQAIKAAGLPNGYAPVAAIILGVAAAIATALAAGSPATAGSWANALILGASWGLAASGLYAGAKQGVKASAGRSSARYRGVPAGK